MTLSYNDHHAGIAKNQAAYYLCLSDKIKRWCQDALFCEKMTTHWREKDHWLKPEHDKCFKKCEIWHGSRFAEFAWFLDPTAQWLLPALCPLRKHAVNSKDVDEACKQNMNADGTVSMECTNCCNCFNHLPKSTRGDPRNIALIGHWDGWQPFSTSSKHSCGKYKILEYINTQISYQHT